MKGIFKLITMTAIISTSLILVEGIIYVPTQVVLNLNPFMPSLLMNAIICLRALLMFEASWKVQNGYMISFKSSIKFGLFLFLSILGLIYYNIYYIIYLLIERDSKKQKRKGRFLK